ncbi:MAG: hypothetical protein WC216_04905 [Gallionella sp.]
MTAAHFVRLFDGYQDITARCALPLFQQRTHLLQGRKILQGTQVQVVEQLSGGREQLKPGALN